jgi:hypothetical protein
MRSTNKFKNVISHENIKQIRKLKLRFSMLDQIKHKFHYGTVYNFL